MKLFAFGTAGLVLALWGSADAFAPDGAADLSPGTVRAISVPADLTANESFQVVDKGEQGTDPSQNDSSSASAAENFSIHKSVESSGNPAEASGVPMPRAGWISFLGLLGVIVLRHFSLSRRRAAGNVMS